jgi:hypothetical protein
VTTRNPVEFTDEQGQRVGNQVVLATALVDGESQVLLTDEITGALATISVVHHEIHEGEMFHVSYKAPDASPIADNGTITFVVETGNRWCHITPLPAMGGDAEFELRRGVVFTGGTGTGMARYNKNQGKSTVATATVTRNPTITNPGVLMENDFLPGGTGGNAIGTSGGERDEWILDINKTYMFRLTNRAGNAQPGSLRIEWYEEGEN